MTQKLRKPTAALDNFKQLDKAQQKHRLIMEWGRLIQPLEELTETAVPPTTETAVPPTIADYRLAFSKAEAGKDRMVHHVHDFCTFNDVKYEPTLTKLLNLISLYAPNFWKFVDRQTLSVPANAPLEAHVDALESTEHVFGQFIDLVARLRAEFFKLIEEVPIKWEATLYQANTPFTVCMRIQDVIAGVRYRLDYFDRYVKEDFFQLYLRHVDRARAIRLVTTRGNATSNGYGVEMVKPLSELFRQEFKDYKLIQVSPTDLHGRYLRVDNQIFGLDSSTSNAGKYPTLFTPAPSEPSDHKVFDDIINLKGSVVH